jgi:hypothetical protein
LVVENIGKESKVEQPGTLYEAVDYDIDDEEMEANRVGVAAQIEVLYNVTRFFKVGSLKSDADKNEDSMQLEP